MKFLKPAIVVFCLWNLVPASYANPERTTTAQPAANFTIHTPQLVGSLTELQGKVVYVDFWASWCKPCRKSFPWMNEMQAKYSTDLQVIAINLDTDAELAAMFLQQVPATMPIIYDPEGEIAKAYQIIGMPSSYIIDKQGNLRFSHKGFFKQNQAQYEQQIQTLISEKG